MSRGVIESSGDCFGVEDLVPCKGGGLVSLWGGGEGHSGLF